MRETQEKVGKWQDEAEAEGAWEEQGAWEVSPGRGQACPCG